MREPDPRQIEAPAELPYLRETEAPAELIKNSRQESQSPESIPTTVDPATRAPRSSSAGKFHSRPRLRQDLVVSAQTVGGQPAWHVKDPLTLKYFTFTEHELAILEMLDGRHSPHQVRNSFLDRFPGQQLSIKELLGFLSSLRNNELLVQPREASTLSSATSKPTWWKRLHPTRLLAIRLPGLDIEPLLNWIYPAVSWAFSWHSSAVLLASILLACVVMVGRGGAMWAQVADIEAFLNLQNLIWLGVALSLTRLLHEMAHALTNRHFGGECHDAGILLLVFTPCLYCDVTDAWTATKRWQRMSISSAGIIMDLFVASVAVLLWNFAAPGFFQHLLLNIVLVCGVSTVLVNGNPLLRYDGYYILSDFLHAPNLWQRSRESMQASLGRWFLGRFDPADQVNSWFTVYGLASASYRVIVLIGITLLAYRLLTPVGLRLVVDVFVATTAVMMCGKTVRKTGQLLLGSSQVRGSGTRSPHVRRYRWLNLGMTAFLLTGLGYLVVFIPVAANVSAWGEIQFAPSQAIYVSKPGILQRAARQGATVQQGDVLAQLESSELRLELMRVAAQVQQQTSRVNNLEAIQFDDPRMASQLPAARELLEDWKQQWQEKQSEFDALTIVAPQSGTLLHAQTPIIRSTAHQDQLPDWDGSPLELRNLGSYLERGTELGQIANASQVEIIAVIGDEAVGRVREDAAVDVLLQNGRSELIRGTVEQLANRDLPIVPQRLLADKSMVGSADKSGIVRPTMSSYQIRITIDPEFASVIRQRQLARGLRVRVKIHTAPETIFRRSRRWVKQNFLW